MKTEARRPRQRLSAQQVATEELRERILTGELKPGEQLVQELIAAQFGVSRVPLREALKMLEGEGLVESSPNHGYYVTKLSRDEILEIYRVRDLLEDEATIRAVPLLDDDDFERLEAANARLDLAYKEQDLIAILVANREFHDAIFSRGATSRLMKLIRMVWDSVEPYRSQYFREAEWYEAQIQEHRGIIDAARLGDVERVLELSRIHRRHAVDAMVGLLSEVD